MNLKFLFSIVTALLLLNFQSVSQDVTEQKPNILWITIEDTSPNFIGCYGNKEIKTPHIDALAKEGVRFTNAYSTNTVCAPSRFTILTGVRTSAAGTGNHRTNYHIPSEITGFPYLLKASGYYTTNNAKTDYNVAEEKALISANWNESSAKADYRNRKSRQPFFSVYNFNDSHQSRTMTNSHDWYVKNVLEKIPADERAKPDEVIVPSFYRDSPEIREQMVRLYNSIHLTDTKVGELIARLKADGEWENTIVFFFGDHGQGMPGFKTHASSLGHKVPFVIRVPAKFQKLVPGQQGTTNGDFLNFEDLAPTLLSITGIPVPKYMKGTVLLGPQKKKPLSFLWGARDNTDEVIDLGRTVIQDSLVYIRNYYPYLPTMQWHKYMDVSDIMQLIRRDEKEGKLNTLQTSMVKAPRPAEGLFNIKQDPWETRNLVHVPAYQNRLNQLRKLNQEFILKNRDVLFAPEYELARIDKTDTLYNFRNDDAKYPVKRILETAEMVGKSKAFIPKQLERLKDKNAVVRYWAVIGLHSEETKFLDEKSLEKSLENEPENFVRIEIGSLLLNHFGNKNAEDFLLKMTDNTNSALVRQTLRALINSGKPDNSITETALALRKKLAEKPFKTLNYEVNTSIDLIMHIAGIEKLSHEN